MRERSEKRKSETTKWKKGDTAEFVNGVKGTVTEVLPTSLKIRIGLGKSQKYNPKHVTKVEGK